jgi:hypothetical protein
MALEIFESMNDRGLRLSSMDMLKSYILSRIAEPTQVESANKLWRAHVQDLREKVKNGDTEFMKTFLRAKYAETVRDTKKSAGAKDFEEIATVFHKWLRDKADDFGLKKGTDFVRFVEKDTPYFSMRYQQLLDASEKLIPGYEYVFYNAHNDFTLQNMVILASVSVEDNDHVFQRKANLVAAYIDIMVTRRMDEYKNFGYSPMYRPMFALAKEIRNKTSDEVKSILVSRAAELPESIDSLLNIRLTKTNKPDIYYLLARMTSWLEDERSEKYFARNFKDPFEVEHIWANKYERHASDFQNEFEFDEHRNKFGDLLLLPKSFNASFGALEYEKKYDKYFGQNLLAQTLNENAYSNHPSFLKKVKDFNLPFKPYPPKEFSKESIVERQSLYWALAKAIWPDNLLENL